MPHPNGHPANMMEEQTSYSTLAEARSLFDLVLSLVDLPVEAKQRRGSVSFVASRQKPYFPIPFKETELGAALKAVEACVMSALAGREGSVTIDLDRTTAFLCQTYLSSINGHGKLDPQSKHYLKDTDLLQAQSNPYRRMSANLYETKRIGEYYHIHGSLEASTTLRMLGLEPFRPDLKTHEAIVECIETRVRDHTIEQLEALNQEHRQAGTIALTHENFTKSSHGRENIHRPPLTVEQLENATKPVPMPSPDGKRVLAGIKVLELCRVIAGPIMGRILAEYGADVLKITSPHLSDVPFFQVDCNMGKCTADLDLKSPEGRQTFEKLLTEADVVLDGYRPGVLERLGYGTQSLKDLALKRGKGYVYVNENCFGFQGEWAHRSGWQQIADCVTGVAWEQGRFMGLDEPVVPPFPISDYGTGCMGAIAALTGLYYRAQQGGSWHGKTSLMQYDLLLFRAGKYPPAVLQQLRKDAGEEFLALRHHNSVDQISGAALRRLRALYPELFMSDHILESRYSKAYQAELKTVVPVVQIEGVNNSFQRASRPNGSDAPSWDFEA